MVKRVLVLHICTAALKLFKAVRTFFSMLSSVHTRMEYVYVCMYMNA